VREYTYAARSGGRSLVTSEELDIYQQTRRAASLGIASKNVIVFTCGERRRYVTLADLYVIEDGEKRAFVGERAFTAAILDVTAATKQKLYFLTGHGEMEPGSVAADRGLSQLRDELRARNFDVDILDLVKSRRIPDDAAMLLAIGPRVPYLPEEQDKLRDYLANKSAASSSLSNPVPTKGSTSSSSTGVCAPRRPSRRPQPPGIRRRRRSHPPPFSTHPVTKLLVDNQITLLAGRVRVVRPDPRRAPDPTLKVTDLIGASPSAWGERTYRDASTAQFDAGVDIKGTATAPSLPVAVVSERVTAADLPFSIRGGRLIVLGTADIFGNNRLDGGNLVLARNAINWATERDTQLNIPPRPVAKFQLALSQTELGKLRLALLLVVPGAVALLGLFVYWSRRS
jgi:hypothetical protein